MENIILTDDGEDCGISKLFKESNNLEDNFVCITKASDGIQNRQSIKNITYITTDNLVDYFKRFGGIQIFGYFKVIKHYSLSTLLGVPKIIDCLVPNDAIVNQEEGKYLDLLYKILSSGELRSGRNGNTWSLFHNTLEFDLSSSFPLLTTKKMFFRGVVAETLFFLGGQTDAKVLSRQGVKIWDENTSRETLDKLGFKEREEGDMGPMYGHQFYHFGAEYKDCHTNYSNQGFNQIEHVINLLINDRNSRRILLTSFNPAQVNEGCLPPCHSIVVQFYVSKGKYLDTICYNRSQDLFLGVPWNIAYIALFVKLLCRYINLKQQKEELIPGKLILDMADTHIYENHKMSCIKQLLRLPYSFPKLDITKDTPKNSFKDYILSLSYDNFELKDYNSHSALKENMSI